ncbi:MAG: hypothetical protein US48_C0042G0003 [Candidatus Levybacteria bacterium GW2011_GWA2_37_36]|uniref:Uncharacterized protein n=1 Tax=Candidatus Roizmanbacteria bacterium GW2011_GWC2_34_23 TaxID=1618484 RepID=A0A0G0DDA3_9BACT|nr:MAG: hypothetical protein UR56_C0015G0011 [Candidatus Roizmanbacteria bacterium GW2011_GWC2_34_23]KKQ31924.1 MAG: hypothetical protein US48_C0042G0003 [Candidatus Levybacteria bacterium GW2011_GWA2_37_36]
MEYASSIRKIELEHFRKFTQINLCDATLLTSLRALSLGRSCIVIDPNERAARNIISELTSDTPVLNFLYDDKDQRDCYNVIIEKIFSDSELTEELRTIYRDLWKKREVNQGPLVFIDSTIEKAAQQIKEPLPIADLVTYYYPDSPYTKDGRGPLFKALQLASLLLKPGGKFEVRSENKRVIDDFRNYAGKFVTRSGFVKRNGKDYQSACELALGQFWHYEISIKNIRNELPGYISARKGLRAMAYLGLIT